MDFYAASVTQKTCYENALFNATNYTVLCLVGKHFQDRNIELFFHVKMDGKKTAIENARRKNVK